MRDEVPELDADSVRRLSLLSFAFFPLSVAAVLGGFCVGAADGNVLHGLGACAGFEAGAILLLVSLALVSELSF